VFYMGVVIVEGKGAVLGVNLGHPTVTHCNYWGLCDTALPGLLWARVVAYEKGAFLILI